MKKKKPIIYTMRRIALCVLTVKVKASLEKPDSERGRAIARTMQGRTGISGLMIQRFHNAILRGKTRKNFSGEAVEDLSWKLFKGILLGERFPNAKMRGDISRFANQYGFPLNLVLQTFRMTYKEVIEEQLADQKKF